MYGVKWMNQAKGWSVRGYRGYQWVVVAGRRATRYRPGTGVGPDEAISLDGKYLSSKQARLLADRLIKAAAMWEVQGE